MIEPNARRRLQLIARTSRDDALVRDLRQVLGEDHTMPFVPSAELLRDIALCVACTQDPPRSGRAGFCDDHRARWNFEACTSNNGDAGDAWSIERLVHGVLESPEDSRQLLSAFDRQRRALRLVLEAHARGAVSLPDSIARTVERAATSGPRFLTGLRSTKQAVS